MNITLEILKKIYIEEVRKIRELPYYKYICIERTAEIKKKIITDIINDQNPSLQVNGFIEGALLNEIRGNRGGDTAFVAGIPEKAIDWKRTERDNGTEMLHKERQNIRDSEYSHAIDYILNLLLIKNLEKELLTFDIRPELDVDGSISFKLMNNASS